MAQSPIDLPTRYLEEEEGLSQECKDLLPSLPREKGWIVTNLYQYHGFWYTTRQLDGTLLCQKHFQAQNTDLFLVTNPKSGTTWLKAITYSIVNRMRYPFNNDHPLLIADNPHDLVPFLEQRICIENKIADFSNLNSPRLFSTHIPYSSLPESIKESKCKIVYLCRDPKDTFISMYHFTNKLRPTTAKPKSLEDAFDRFCRGVSVHGPFWDHVLGYWKESLANPERMLFLKYEEMKTDPIVHLTRLAEFMGCPFSPEEKKDGVMNETLKLCSFENLSNLEVNKTGNLLLLGESKKAYFRQGKVGDWKNHLSKEMVDHMDKITEHKLHGSGLMF